MRVVKATLHRRFAVGLTDAAIDVLGCQRHVAGEGVLRGGIGGGKATFGGRAALAAIRAEAMTVLRA